MRSDLKGFYRLSMAQRRRRIAELAGLNEADVRVLSGEDGLCADQANQMVENALGTTALPLGVCVNLVVDGADRLVPMAIEEASVVAAASHAAKLVRAGGGVQVEVSAPIMIGQVQLTEVPDMARARAAVEGETASLLAQANRCDPCLLGLGGGARDLQVRTLMPLPEADDDPLGPMMVIHLLVDVRDAMGANTVNTMCENLAPNLEALTGGRARLRIVSNLAAHRTVRARGRVPFAAFEGKGCDTGEELAGRVVEASVFAERDPFRAATHNKGIMNGVDAVLIAFGQDWRAVEAGAHAYAARGGRYGALARWRIRERALCGELELPMPVGTVGGIIDVHPTVRAARRLARVKDAADLAGLTAAVGLCQNLGALRALAAEGIQRGHMRVHARNVATAVGAMGPEVEQVARIIAERGQVCAAAARQTLRHVRTEPSSNVPERDIWARFSTLRDTYLPHIMSLIGEVLRRANPDGSNLTSMCYYHLETGGKRLRALLPLMVAEAQGVDPAYLVPFGAACEMLHNATLVHDDLQDGDTMRRTKETVWHRFGHAQAVNLGDAMFYYTLLLIGRLDAAPSRRQLAVRRTLEETLRVIDGQEREFALRRTRLPTLDDYFAMVQGKTSGLFALPLAGAAELCGSPGPVSRGLEDAARHMGVLFQIQDDVLDLYADKGRDLRGNDVREGKRSLLAIHALQAASAPDVRRLREILDKDREATTERDVQEALDVFRRAGSLEYALCEIAERKNRARSVEALAEHPRLRALVADLCDLFLRPIRQVIARTGSELRCSKAV